MTCKPSCKVSKIEPLSLLVTLILGLTSSWFSSNFQGCIFKLIHWPFRISSTSLVVFLLLFFFCYFLTCKHSWAQLCTFQKHRLSSVGFQKKATSHALSTTDYYAFFGSQHLNSWAFSTGCHSYAITSEWLIVGMWPSLFKLSPGNYIFFYLELNCLTLGNSEIYAWLQISSSLPLLPYTYCFTSHSKLFLLLKWFWPETTCSITEIHLCFQDLVGKHYVTSAPFLRIHSPELFLDFFFLL